MRANRPRDTGPERAIRSALHARGLRYQLHRRAVRDVRSEADLLFPKERVAVYVDGCFWHSCPQHRVLPKANAAWWKSKLQANVDRDRRVDAALAGHGWTVVRIWEHEPPESAADVIEAAVRTQRSRVINRSITRP